MKRKILFPLLLAGAALTSCMSIALNHLGIFDKEAPLRVYTNGDKILAYMPMKHIGPKEFYANIKHKVDSLESEGFIVFLESVRLTDSLTEKEKEILDLKLRKMMGVHVDNKGYLDTVNNRLMGRRYKNKKGLINQPKYSLLGADSLTSRVVDVPVNEIIREYEQRYGTILLNPCDWTTAPEEKYKCGTEPRSQVNEMILDLRNQRIANAIAEEKHKKIAVLYGALHEWGIFKRLQAIDTAWVRQPRIIQ